MVIKVTPLGAGRQVGRSCILLEIDGKRILLDCGVSVAAKGGGHIPEFDFLLKGGASINESLDLVLISHFHLDHIGSLPYLTEVLGYRGPILMTHPTRAIASFLLEDYLKHQSRMLYTYEQIETCLARSTCLQLRERHVAGDISVTTYYAGHVIGAVMFLIECRGQKALYTGDFTMVPDHHLSAARMPVMIRPDVMITESTYATTIRSSKRLKEQELCRKIQETLGKGGKVLVPTFAIGRAQELCLLCEKHWTRAKLNYPIFIGRGMLQKALRVFRLFSSWSSMSVRKVDNPLDFPHVQQYDSPLVAESDSAMVLLAGPAMLNGGLSLDVFKKWAPDAKNMIIFPGFPLPGTIGNEVLGGSKRVEVGESEVIDVRCQVEYMSHSDHTDGRGIMQLIAQAAPKHVVLVHGSESQVSALRPIVEQRLRIPCSAPKVLESVDVWAGCAQEVMVSPEILRHAEPLPRPCARGEPLSAMAAAPEASSFSGLLRKRKRDSWELFDLSADGLGSAGLMAHVLRYRHEELVKLETFRASWAKLEAKLRKEGCEHCWTPVMLPEVGPLPQSTLRLVFLDVHCTLSEPAAPASEEDQVNIVVTWTRAAMHHSSEVSSFLEMLGAG